MRKTYIIRDGELIEKNSEMSSSVPYVISDEMEPLRHMADGRMYSSKRKFRDATKAAGCVEYGSEIPTLLTPRKKIPLDRAKRRDDIRRVMWELRNGIKRAD